MRAWWTAADLAGLPGLPGTERGLHIRAERELWQSREQQRDARGRRAREYHVSSLPEAVRAELARRDTGDADLPAPIAEPPPCLASLSDAQRRAVAARRALLGEVDRLAPAMGVGQARATVARLAGEGRLPDGLQTQVASANARAGSGRTLSTGSLRRWAALAAEGGAAALAPRDGLKAQTAPPPAWLQGFLRLYLRPSKPSVAQAFEAWLRELAAEERAAAPQLRTVQREIHKLGAVVRNRGRMGPRELRKVRVYTVRDFAGLSPSDVYSADGHCADFEVQHPLHGKPFRPEIVSVLDIATRRCVGWSAGLAESAWLVADALRHACTAAGIPAIWYVDRGSGFINAYMDDEVTGLLARLGVTRETSLPYNSQARGVVERAHQSIWVRAGRELPAFVGRAMDREARQIVFKRGRQEVAQAGRSRYVMPWADFLSWAAEQFGRYNARAHASLGRRSPDEAWQAWLDGGGRPLLPSEAEAADLFRPHERRTVDRGQVRLFGGVYFSTELELLDLHGREVLVAYDIHDPSAVQVRDLEGRLLCSAALDGNRADYFPKARVEQARERRAAQRLKRLAGHAEEARAELGPAARAPERLPDLTEEQRENAAAVLARLAPPEPEPAEGERPMFHTDIEMYRWLVGHPDQATPEDWAYIERALAESSAFRLQVQLEDEKRARSAVA